jgi:lysophospholipase L1-like esterase
MKRKFLSQLLVAGFALLNIHPLKASGPLSDVDYTINSKTIQLNVKSLLNARVVTTCTSGRLVTWNKGIDGEWSGLATRTAADSMGSRDKLALPDNGIFPATQFHPLVVMNYSNGDGLSNQVRFTAPNTEDSYSINVPVNYYSTLSLFFMSAFGTSDIIIEIFYSDKTSEILKVALEDWAVKITESDTKYFLSADLAKWGNKNTELEKDHHYVMGINVKPAAGKKAVKIKITKPASSTSLVFWGATGYGAVGDTWTIPGNSPLVSYEGRTLVANDNEVRLAYPGIVTRLNFKGTSLSMNARANSAELYLDISIDGKTPAFLKVPEGESEVQLVQGLLPGEHQLAIYKRVESFVGILDILSFKVTGEFLRPDVLPSRKLLFMGDSFTTGQATTVEDGGKMDPSKAMRQNARLCYSRLLADKFQAQCHIIGCGGKGIVRDWQGLTSARLAPEYYEYTLPDDVTTKWDPQKYVPDLIGICLGNNDFGIGVPDQVSYINAYTEFVRKLRRDAPEAFILLITSPSLTDDPGKVPMRTVQKAYLEEVVQRLGDPRVQVVQIAHYEGVPGDFHPSGTSHRAVANELEPVIRKLLNW